MSERKPYHYWAIHKRVFRRLWNELSPRQRELVAHDAEQKSETFKRFVGEVAAETQRLFEKVDYPFNEAHTFKIPYYQVETEEVAAGV
jgi:hypothetical protein